MYLEGANESIKRQVRRILSSYFTLAILDEVYLNQRKLIAVDETQLIHTIVNEIHKRNGHIGVRKTYNII